MREKPFCFHLVIRIIDLPQKVTTIFWRKARRFCIFLCDPLCLSVVLRVIKNVTQRGTEVSRRNTEMTHSKVIGFERSEK